MNARLLRLALVAAVLGLNNAHVSVLQMVAWARMAVQFSRTATVQCALQQTLDGEHPCAMCMKLRKAPVSDASLGNTARVDRTDMAFIPSARSWMLRMLPTRIHERRPILASWLPSPDFPPPR